MSPLLTEIWQLPSFWLGLAALLYLLRLGLFGRAQPEPVPTEGFALMLWWCRRWPETELLLRAMEANDKTVGARLMALLHDDAPPGESPLDAPGRLS